MRSSRLDFSPSRSRALGAVVGVAAALAAGAAVAQNASQQALEQGNIDAFHRELLRNPDQVPQALIELLEHSQDIGPVREPAEGTAAALQAAEQGAAEPTPTEQEKLPQPAMTEAGRQVDPADIQVQGGYNVEPVVTGLTYAVDVTWGDDGTMYVAEAGGHTYGTKPEEAPPARILAIAPDGTKRVVHDKVVPLETVRKARVYEDIPEGIIQPITGVTWHDGLLYVSHRTRISTLDPETGDFKTVVDQLPSWGEFLNTKPIFRDGKMYFTQATQGNLGPIGSHFMKVITIFNKPLAREVPCEDVTLRGVDFWVRNGFTKEDKNDAKLSGVYVPFGVQTSYGQTIPGQPKCNGAFYKANPDGTELEVIAWGLRSNFGYDFSPAGRLVATQNSCNPIPPRQVYDDWEPVYEIVPGTWYGWPEFCSSVPIIDPRFILPNDEDFAKEYGQESPEHHTFVLTDETRARLLKGEDAPPEPLAKLPVHSAAEGMVFGREEFGVDPENEILVALFGNIVPILRDEQPGFRVAKVNLRTGEHTDFLVNNARGPASTGNKGLERPIQLAWGPDGALYVVDFGIINITKTGMHAVPNSGLIWKVRRADAAGEGQRGAAEPLDPAKLYAEWAGDDGELTVDEWDAEFDRVLGEEAVALEVADWNTDGNGIISRAEFEAALAEADLPGIAVAS